MRAVVLTVASMLGLLLTGVGSAPPASAAVTGVIGSASGYRLDVTLFGGPVNTRGPAPNVTLPPGGSATAVTGNAASGSAIVGPAVFFSSGPLSVSTQGTPAGGSVTSTTSIGTINTSGQETFSANGASSTCTASEAGATGSATITNGVLFTDSGDDLNDDGDYADLGEHTPVTIPVPAAPAPNTTFQGHIHVNGVVETFTYVFNEQIVNPDGSLTVNAGHEYLHGPTAVGELTWGHAVCGVLTTAATYAPVSPFRVWDSRVGPGPVGTLGPAQTRNVTVAGVAGSGVPASGVTAVVLNVTAVGPTAGTFVTVWPAGETKPNASNLNVPPGDTRPNLVTVKVGVGGQVSFYNDAGNVHLIGDVAGWYGPAAGQRFSAVSPFRVWDSRVGTGPVGTLGPAQTRNVTVAGVAGSGVPASGVTAVVLNVTAVGPTAGTFVTVWPAGETKPNASNLNVPPGDTRPNLVIVKVGAGNQVSFYNDAGNVHLIADIAGYFSASGARFTSVSPSRVWDSRVGPGPVGTLGPAQTRNVTVAGVVGSGVPASGVTAVVLNVTAVGPTAGTFVTVWPAGETKPNTSNLNVPPGDTRPNLVTVKVGVGGQVSFYNDAGNVHLIADVAGWYGAAEG